ncbi:MAG: hypothetical protein R3C03_07015 [Pirellulaceae bacterium]
MSIRLNRIVRLTFASLTAATLTTNAAGIASAWQFGTLTPPAQEETQQENERAPITFGADEFQSNQQATDPAADLLDVTRQLTREPDQKVLVREKYAGWKNANLSDRQANLSDSLRSNWVMISNTGRLDGHLLPAEGVDVSKVPIYLLNHGAIVSQTKTDEHGNFVFENIQEDTYSLIAFGDNAFCAFGFNALDYRESTATHMPSAIHVMAVPNKTTINLDWIRHFAPSVHYRVFGRFESKEGTEDPAELYGIDGLATHGPEATESTSIGFHKTKLGDGNSLVGRLHQIDELNGRPVDVRGMRVILLQNDDVYSAVSVDNFGVFEINDVAPGQYALAAVGNDGMACIGIEAVGAGVGAGDVVDLALVSPDTVGWLNHTAHEVAYQRVIGRPVAPKADNQQQCFGDISSLYCTRNSRLRQFWNTINCYFDLAVYGETTSSYGSQGGYGGSYGNSGYGNSGYGYGGYGYGGYGYGGYGAGCNGGNCFNSGYQYGNYFGSYPYGAFPNGGCSSCGGTGCYQPFVGNGFHHDCGGTGCHNPGCSSCHPQLETSQPISAPPFQPRHRCRFHRINLVVIDDSLDHQGLVWIPSNSMLLS